MIKQISSHEIPFLLEKEANPMNVFLDSEYAKNDQVRKLVGIKNSVRLNGYEFSLLTHSSIAFSKIHSAVFNLFTIWRSERITLFNLLFMKKDKRTHLLMSCINVFSLVESMLIEYMTDLKTSEFISDSFRESEFYQEYMKRLEIFLSYVLDVSKLLKKVHSSEKILLFSILELAFSKDVSLKNVIGIYNLFLNLFTTNTFTNINN